MRVPLGGLLSLILASPALAASPQVGQDAPDFDQVNWVMNPPSEGSVQALRGEVVIVEKWGVNCPPCLALIPHVQKLQEEFGARGLHIFAFEAQNHGPDEVRSTVTQRGGRTYTVSAGGANNYQTDGGIPHAWIVGVDGKIAWQGNPGDGRFDQTLRAEMAKVRFPGLGRNEVDAALNKSMQAFLRGDLASARKEARKVLEGARSTDAAKADAEYVVTRLATIAERRTAEAREHEQAGRWLEAHQAWTALQTAFNREPEGDAAKARLDEMKKDDDLKKELDAARRLQQVLSQLEGRPAEERRAALTQFARGDRVAGTAAARRAEEMAH